MESFQLNKIMFFCMVGLNKRHSFYNQLGYNQ
nr:MAG TPA: hypothetical protein [Caudoviricetes sp.]